MVYHKIPECGKCEEFKRIFLRSVGSGVVAEGGGLHGKPAPRGRATSVCWEWTCHLLKPFWLCEYPFVWWLLPLAKGGGRVVDNWFLTVHRLCIGSTTYTWHTTYLFFLGLALFDADISLFALTLTYELDDVFAAKEDTGWDSPQQTFLRLACARCRQSVQQCPWAGPRLPVLLGQDWVNTRLLQV